MYDLELNKAAERIKKEKSESVCIQLADGLKPRAKEAVDFLRANTNAEILIWGGSCFGACDIPKLDVDLLIQFGHSNV
ncbi:hypothetical protein GF323_01330 [Candidatus Woesearchaeota archaeon]|nr:hypothetical protein [Candidatus Woesearchaeota archaeon]